MDCASYINMLEFALGSIFHSNPQASLELCWTLQVLLIKELMGARKKV
jgi:hypothetical protein